MKNLIKKQVSFLIEIENKKHEEFFINEYFDIKGGYYNKKPPATQKGSVPFLGASALNNGITQFSSREDILKYDKVGDENSSDIEKRFFPPNCLAITNNGSVGHAYYQEIEFTCSHDITVVYLKEEKIGRSMNKYLATYLIVPFERTGETFKYSRKWRPKRMIRSKILMPVTDQGTPDWEYMEQQGKRLYERKQNDIFEYLKKKQLELKTQLSKIKEPIIEEITWKTFEVEEMFGVKRVSGEPLNKYDEGNLPFISTSSQKNGVQGFVNSKKEDVSPKNSLTISPIDGTIFFHSYNFVGRGGAGSSISTMTNENLNKYIGLFIKTMIEASSKHKASYGVQLNGKRLKSTKFYLPVTDDNEPDWKFMEYYMKKIEYKQISKLIKYLN